LRSLEIANYIFICGFAQFAALIPVCGSLWQREQQPELPINLTPEAGYSCAGERIAVSIETVATDAMAGLFFLHSAAESQPNRLGPRPSALVLHG
jgi:hypothetical protein